MLLLLPGDGPQARVVVLPVVRDLLRYDEGVTGHRRVLFQVSTDARRGPTPSVSSARTGRSPGTSRRASRRGCGRQEGGRGVDDTGPASAGNTLYLFTEARRARRQLGRSFAVVVGSVENYSLRVL